MKYEAAREKVKSGDLLAWSHRGWRSWYDIQIQLVRFFTQSEYSHVGIAWVVGGRVHIPAIKAGRLLLGSILRALDCRRRRNCTELRRH
jgi:hypothetical protein